MAYRFTVPTVGSQTVIYKTEDFDRLIDDIRLMVKEEESVTLTVEHVEMSSEEVEALPEFMGY